MPQGGVATAEQRLYSDGTTGHGVLGLGAAIVWGMGFLVRREWLKGAEPEISAGGPARKARRRSRRDGCGRCAERMAREEGDSDRVGSSGQWQRGERRARPGLRRRLDRSGMGWSGAWRWAVCERTGGEREMGRGRAGGGRAGEVGAGAA